MSGNLSSNILSPVSAEWIAQFTRARYIIGSLGEVVSPPWWRSEATTEAGGKLLLRLFPRTLSLARLELVSRGASRRHDERIGRIGIYHLFRLPHDAESVIISWIHGQSPLTLLPDFNRGADDGQFPNLMGHLRSLSSAEVAPEVQGPVSCGKVSSITEPETLERVCGLYLMAFQNDQPVYPYFEV